jgi:hypothetical protein
MTADRKSGHQEEIAKIAEIAKEIQIESRKSERLNTTTRAIAKLVYSSGPLYTKAKAHIF